MKNLALILILILSYSCSNNQYACKTYRQVNKPKVSTAQHFPLKQRTDIFGNKVYRAWDLNLKSKK